MHVIICSLVNKLINLAQKEHYELKFIILSDLTFENPKLRTIDNIILQCSLLSDKYAKWLMWRNKFTTIEIVHCKFQK